MYSGKAWKRRAVVPQRQSNRAIHPCGPQCSERPCDSSGPLLAVYRKRLLIIISPAVVCISDAVEGHQPPGRSHHPLHRLRWQVGLASSHKNSGVRFRIEANIEFEKKPNKVYNNITIAILVSCRGVYWCGERPPHGARRGTQRGVPLRWGGHRGELAHFLRTATSP